MIRFCSKSVLNFQKTGLVLTLEGKRSIHFLKKVWLKWWRDKKWNTTALHHGCLVRKVKIVNTSWKLCVRSLRTLTWSRGTNSRLPFEVNVNLNLFNIWHSIMNSLITSNNPTSTCSVSTLFHNGVSSCPCSFVAQRGNSGNEEVSFFADILCSFRIWSLVLWVQLWPSVVSINRCAHSNDQFHQRKQDWARISGGDHDVQMLGAIQAELILSWEDKIGLCSRSGRI